ncbi:hypothetical protein HEL17_012300 [Escherichia sp. 14.0985]|uniref:hypothetical protein n=1 Tax=Escherichia TaxID=561 RepID=UPI000CF76374|nr:MULTISPECIES: hypothetical protein [Escherichia]MBB2410814.1 hypothetical protein [Escherichia sp. 14.0985]MBB2429269.1 hypothetical protein [Escherichia sp. 12.2612]MBB2452863.1 hypothetical protein [Escherichia sp. 8.2195]MDQ9209423.1 hypothetical protein [Escherichia marmotae]MDZ5519376.1 hypothetical protein [Escherichia marmotae]
MWAFSFQYRSGRGWARCGSSGMFLFLVMMNRLLLTTEAIWLLLQCDKLWLSWLVAKNFDDWGVQKNWLSFS